MVSATAAMRPASRMDRAGMTQPRRIALMVSASPIVPAAIAAPVSATAR